MAKEKSTYFEFITKVYILLFVCKHQIVEQLRASFNAGKTRSKASRVKNLKAVLRLIKDHQEDIYDAVYKDLRKVCFFNLLCIFIWLTIYFYLLCTFKTYYVFLNLDAVYKDLRKVCNAWASIMPWASNFIVMKKKLFILSTFILERQWVIDLLSTIFVITSCKGTYRYTWKE